MNIQLIRTRAVNIELTLEEPDLELQDSEPDFSFDFNPLIPSKDETTDEFVIAFFGKIKSYKDFFECKVIFVAEFKTDENFDKNFLTNKFALINAPAIGYPYFRAFMSNLLMNAGYNNTILPTINFVNLRAEKEQELQEKQNEIDSSK